MLLDKICCFGRHKADRKRTWHDGLNYRSTCSVCRKTLIKNGERWRVFDSRKDYDERRRAHPHHNRLPV